MSQMDLSQQSVSDEERGPAEDEFVDAVDSFEHLPIAHENGSHHESNYGILERCGRWLMAIPRDDVVALQRTSEYREFLSAFDKLGEAHRRTVMLERQHLMEREDDDMAEYSFASGGSNIRPQSSPTNAIKRSSASITTRQRPAISHPLLPPSSLRRRTYSFLQHLAVDDVLLRIFEFIDCSSLVRTGTTCHRFHALATQSAEQRTHRLADGRLLRSAMKMLRAQEQIEGVGPREEAGPFVPIPMLGLRRRVKVSGAGDPEYNGIYFCTGSNGNGFLFTKPRRVETKVRVLNNTRTQQLDELDGPGGIEEANNDFVAPGVAVGLNAAHAAPVNEDNVDVLFGDEPDRSRLLRCVIAKRFSNEVS